MKNGPAAALFLFASSLAASAFAADCPMSEPHMLKIKGKCRPSCGLILGKKKGLMAPKSCPKGSRYAGYTWEQARYKSKCCVFDEDSKVDKVSGGCDSPPLHHFNLKIHGGNKRRHLMDSTPIVCSTKDGGKHDRYCQETMKDPNRGCCPVKPEGHPMRSVCELELLGRDPKDKVPGPSWYFEGNGWVEKREDNPFLAYTSGHGTVYVCSNKEKKCASKKIDTE